MIAERERRPLQLREPQLYDSGAQFRGVAYAFTLLLAACVESQSVDFERLSPDVVRCPASAAQRRRPPLSFPLSLPLPLSRPLPELELPPLPPPWRSLIAG